MNSKEGEEFLRKNNFFPYNKDHLEEIYLSEYSKEVTPVCNFIKRVWYNVRTFFKKIEFSFS